MFALHESTQRLLCRIGFLSFCIAPTLLVVGWAAAVNSSTYEQSQRAAWETGLTLSVGLETRIGRVTKPSRRVTLLHDVAALAPESDTTLWQARIVEIRRYKDGWLVTASQVECAADRLAEIWRAFHHQRLVRDSGPDSPVWFRCGEVTLRGAEFEQTLTDVAVKHASTTTGPQILVEFQLPGGKNEKSCQLAIRRERSDSPPRTVFDLRTRGTALPCRAVSGSLSLLKAMGDECQFRGDVRLEQGPDGWSGVIANADFLNLELQEVLAACSLHTMRASAIARVESATFRDGRLISIQGGLAADQGVVDVHFLRALNRELQIAVPPDVLDSDRDKLSFRRLAVDYRLDAVDGLYLQGGCGGAFQGAMLLGEQGPLLLQPQRPHATAVALIRALAPENDVMAPATRQTRLLVNVLPVPDVTLSQPERPRGVIRLRDQN